jgi:hypothetical protein
MRPRARDRRVGRRYTAADHPAGLTYASASSRLHAIFGRGRIGHRAQVDPNRRQYFAWEPTACARDRPRLSSVPGGSSASQCRSQLIVSRRCRSLERRRTVKRFEQRVLHRTVTIRPELKISIQTVTEIGTDRLRTRLRTWCTSLAPSCARDRPRLSSVPGGSSASRCRSQYLMVRRSYRSLERRRTVKRFEQRVLHRTVTIRPELKISIQTVTQKIGTDRLRTSPMMAPVAPPTIAPPSGSCAAASCIGIARAMAAQADDPKARINPALR